MKSTVGYRFGILLLTGLGVAAALGQAAENVLAVAAAGSQLPCPSHLLVPLYGAQLGDVLADQITVAGWKWTTAKGFLDILHGGIQISLGSRFADSSRLRRQKQRLAAAVEFLSLLLAEAGMRHGRGYVVSQLENRVTPLLGVNRL